MAFKHVTQARVYVKTLDQYRRLAEKTGRNLMEMMDMGLLYALRNQAEMERELLKSLESVEK